MASGPDQRDPHISLEGCRRILILGRTGSGKTTLARELAAALHVPHVELDALYFGPDLSTVSLPVLRDRTIEAIAGEYWVIDGNKRAVRDLVWPRADTVVWLDYSLWVSLRRLGKRAVRRTSTLTARAAETGQRAGLPGQLLAAAKGVLTALRSHRDSAPSTRGCSPSRRTGTSPWYASGRHARRGGGSRASSARASR
jgi:hypothetical protein